jgi:hypothetical protein
MSPISWRGCPPFHLHTGTEISVSSVPSLCSRDSLHVTRFLVGVSSSSPIHKYRNVSLHCAQPLLKGLTPCHPLPGGGVSLLTYTQVQKCQPPLCTASAQGTHSMSPASWWGCPPPHLYTSTEISVSSVPSLCSRDSLHVTCFLVGVSSSSPIHKYRNISLRCA